MSSMLRYPKDSINPKSFVCHIQNHFSIFGKTKYIFTRKKLQIETKRLYLGTGQCLLGKDVYISNNKFNKIQKELDYLNNILKQIKIRWKKNQQICNTNLFYGASNISNQTINIFKNKLINHFMNNCIIKNNKSKFSNFSLDNQYILLKHKNGSLIHKKIDPLNQQELKKAVTDFMEVNPVNGINGINGYFPVFVVNRKQLESVINNLKQPYNSKSNIFSIISSKFEILSDTKKNITTTNNYTNTSYTNHNMNTFENDQPINNLKTKYVINNRNCNLNNINNLFSMSTTCENNFSIFPKAHNSVSGVDIMHLAYKNKFISDPNYNIYSSDSITIHNNSDFEFFDNYKQNGTKRNQPLKIDFGQTTPLNLLSEKLLIFSISKWSKLSKSMKENEIQFIGNKINSRVIYLTIQKFNLKKFDVTSFTLTILNNQSRISFNKPIIESKDLFNKKNEYNSLNKDNNINMDNVTNSQLFSDSSNANQLEQYDYNFNYNGRINCYSNNNYSIRENSNGCF